jgi:type IX secretion system PorP/SprF family membrane protein
MKKVLQTLLLTIIIFRISAQDPHLSQYYMAPLYLNPALTGAFDGNYRLNGLFRGQWGSVLQNEAVPMYRTYTFSADFRTDRGFAKGDAFGFGASFLGDQAGEAKFGYNVGGISVAYHKSLNGRHTNYLALGFSSQIYDQTFDNSNLQWGSQWDFTTGSYNPNINPNEAIVDNKKLYWDINAGLLWYMKIGRKTDIYLGASAYHLNQPGVSLYGSSAVKLNIKYVGTGGITFPMGGRFYFQPKFIVMDQGQSIETMFTGEVKILFDQREPDNGNFRFGAMLRMVGGDPNAPWTDNRLDPESVVLTTGVEWNHINLGVAYDINVSSLLSATQSRGAFEVGLSYVGRWKRSTPQTIYCPKF